MINLVDVGMDDRLGNCSTGQVFVKTGCNSGLWPGRHLFPERCAVPTDGLNVCAALMSLGPRLLEYLFEYTCIRVPRIERACGCTQR